MKFWLLNLLAAVFAIALYETYVDWQPAVAPHHEKMTYTAPDAELGYTIAGGSRVIDSKVTKDDGTLLFDAHYGIDQRGIRISAEPDAAKDDRPVWFMGDSFTFGVGLNDDETLPSEFAKLSGFRVVNFGIGGQGAHQVLRELEIDRPHALGARGPLAIVYLALPSNHMFRAAGRAGWDENGPRYEIVDGSLQFVGHFPPPSAWASFIHRSGIYRRLIAPHELNTNSQQDRERLLAIVLKCRDLSLSKYHAPFYVLVWNDDIDGGTNTDWLIDNLRSAGVRTLDLAAAIPGLLSGKYVIRGEGHPTGEANRLVAEALEQLIEKNPPQGRGSIAQSASSLMP